MTAILHQIAYKLISLVMSVAMLFGINLDLNKTIITYKDTYYFAIPCSATEKQADGTYAPIKSKM